MSSKGIVLVFSQFLQMEQRAGILPIQSLECSDIKHQIAGYSLGQSNERSPLHWDYRTQSSGLFFLHLGVAVDAHEFFSGTGLAASRLLCRLRSLIDFLLCMGVTRYLPRHYFFQVYNTCAGRILEEQVPIEQVYHFEISASSTFAELDGLHQDNSTVQTTSKFLLN